MTSGEHRPPRLLHYLSLVLTLLSTLPKLVCLRDKYFLFLLPGIQERLKSGFWAKLIIVYVAVALRSPCPSRYSRDADANTCSFRVHTKPAAYAAYRSPTLTLRNLCRLNPRALHSYKTRSSAGMAGIRCEECLQAPVALASGCHSTSQDASVGRFLPQLWQYLASG